MEKMEKEEQAWNLPEPAAGEEEEEEEEVTNLLVRKSRKEEDIKTTSIGIAAVHTNGHQKPQTQEEKEKEEEEEKESKKQREKQEKEWDNNNLVYHDKVQGLWKCRICTWTFGNRNGNLCSNLNHIQNHNQLCHNNLLIFQSQGDESGYNFQNGADPTSDSQASSSQILFPKNKNNTIPRESDKEEVSAEIDLIENEFEVERVIQNQTTHDLYCPNCNSCITKRVILRKRKRTVPLPDDEQIVFDSNTNQSQARDADAGGEDETQLASATEDEEDKWLPIFRCLSCFSFFIPMVKTSMDAPSKREPAAKQAAVKSSEEDSVGGNENSSGTAFARVNNIESTEGSAREIPDDSYIPKHIPKSSGAVEIHPADEVPIVDTTSRTHLAPVQSDAGKDTVINIDASPPPGSSQTVEGSITPTDTASALQQPLRKEVEVEVIKSIVYGGLAESITSLSVVSSAAGGGAASLNILALGMANLFGGLFVVCNNIRELRNEQPIDRRDRYRDVLGRRENFVIHAVAVVTSYLLFGLVPPVAYGLSFRRTDDKQLKLVVVAAASVVCISGLAVAKAYVQRPPKRYLKSVASFVILGLMASGVSYAAGELVERLLWKLGVFPEESESVLAMVAGKSTAAQASS
ncbi:membrane protein of ER body-like protein isoform X2 [Andrographis paniculata]|uniref:membrane protein of ER body-like protein isoform X2 n=1 Tax=Andrographis paniculata TaxID=175694 RepID=UPI0021E7C569|nr:membrane protein of ER body-like protein isoform X2 [Andrographis paniculata]